jgi:stage II sporulation protein AA (anti-sigma F factor antagonist)
VQETPQGGAADPSVGERFRVVGSEGNVVEVAGEIDEDVVDAFRDVLRRPEITAVDMALVTFLNSSGLRILIEAHGERTEIGGGLELRNPSRQVQRVLEITGLVEMFTAGNGSPTAP